MARCPILSDMLRERRRWRENNWLSDLDGYACMYVYIIMRVFCKPSGLVPFLFVVVAGGISLLRVRDRIKRLFFSSSGAKTDSVADFSAAWGSCNRSRTEHV